LAARARRAGAKIRRYQQDGPRRHRGGARSAEISTRSGKRKRPRRNIDLHIHSLWYWAQPESECEDAAAWIVTPELRRVLAEVLPERPDLARR
jgi:hypothetical protein